MPWKFLVCIIPLLSTIYVSWCHVFYFFFFKLRTLLSQVQRAGLHKIRGQVLMAGRGPLLASNVWVLWDYGDRVLAQEHLWDAVVLVDWLGLLALATLGYLGPHLLQILPHVLNALTQPRSVLLLRRLMSPWVLFLTDGMSTESGPKFNSSSSHSCSSSRVICLQGLLRRLTVVAMPSSHYHPQCFDLSKREQGRAHVFYC